MTLVALGAVTVAGYRLHTGDQDTETNAVTGALADAERRLEESLRRHLALEERTDAFRIYPDGSLYPDAYPITASDLAIVGRALRGATADTEPSFVFAAPWSNEATVTWTGGYDEDTLPITLAEAIYDLARSQLSGASTVPAGATSVSVGDASISFSGGGGSSLDTAVPGLSSRVKPWRNRFV